MLIEWTLKTFGQTNVYLFAYCLICKFHWFWPSHPICLEIVVWKFPPARLSKVSRCWKMIVPVLLRLTMYIWGFGVSNIQPFECEANALTERITVKVFVDKKKHFLWLEILKTKQCEINKNIFILIKKYKFVYR